MMFQLAIKVPRATSADQASLMWQNLLADRFKLQVHREQRQIAGYVLRIAKGSPKLKRPGVGAVIFWNDGLPEDLPTFDVKRNKDGSVPEEEWWAWAANHPGRRIMGESGTTRVVFSNTGIADLILMLQNQLQKPVVDVTELEGKYNFRLLWEFMDSPDDSPDKPSIFGALQNQLGLRLDPKKVEVEVLVVDHVEKVPTEN
jgi:uncharacterized protein (TIGR03435 family)